MYTPDSTYTLTLANDGNFFRNRTTVHALHIAVQLYNAHHSDDGLSTLDILDCIKEVLDTWNDCTLPSYQYTYEDPSCH